MNKRLLKEILISVGTGALTGIVLVGVLVIILKISFWAVEFIGFPAH